ncbi:MAG TPA: HD domain-containing protein [bacterium (Candidatus Stahlbacteria)]|nr:HD domain-containing protein [Candidatus Stahlbacteria bacterium]
MHDPEELFPLIAEIRKKNIAEIVISVFCEVQEKRKDIDIIVIPFTLVIPTSSTLIEHTNRVTGMAYQIGRSRGDLDLDLLIGGGLLHDVGKVMTYEKKGDGFVAGSLEKRLRHPFIGACLVAKHGNYDLTHIVYTHSHEGGGLTRSKEAIVINHCDFIDFEIEKRKVQA